MNKSISEEAAITNLKGFFSHSPKGTKEVSLEQIFLAVGRHNMDAAINRSWLANKLTPIRKYNLINPVYEYEGKKRRLTKVKLTPKSEGLLGLNIEHKRDKEEDVSYQNTSPSVRQVTLESIAQDIREYEKHNPSIELDLNVKVRKSLPI